MNSERRNVLDDTPVWLILLAVAALLIGLFARFKGLGTAPFAIDEYYFIRAVELVLTSGWPVYPCGGLYLRGLALQYSTAALQLSGLSAEFAPRLISVCSSLLTLPAAYLIAKRCGGKVLAILIVALLSVSVWEIEMARFARMYAPFQAVFMWHLVFFLRYVIDRDERALWPMFVLTVLGPLTWEGGVFLALVNLLAPLLRDPTGRWSRRDWLYMAAGSILLILAYVLVTKDFSGDQQQLWPPQLNHEEIEDAPSVLDVVPTLLVRLLGDPAWQVAALIPLSLAVLAGRWLWSWRTRPLALIGLTTALLGALLGQFGIALGVLVLLLLLRMVRWQELFARPALSYCVALSVAAGFWLTYNIVSVDWSRVVLDPNVPRWVLFTYQLFAVPDVLNVVIRPFNRSIPILGLLLTLPIAVSAIRQMREANPALSTERVLLVVLVILVMASGAGNPPRVETRYVFFLYPIALMLAACVALRATSSVSAPRSLAVSAGGLLVCIGFALSEDFQPQHIAHIDSPAALFRTDVSAELANHLILRDDVRSAANWLKANADSERDAVAFNYHGLDHYYPGADYFYLDYHYPVFHEFTCAAGTVDRWSNRPLVFTNEQLQQAILRHDHTYVVTFSGMSQELLQAFAESNPTVAWKSGGISIVRIDPK